VISLQKVNSLIVLVKRRGAKKLCAKWRLQDYNFEKSGVRIGPPLLDDTPVKAIVTFYPLQKR
jgi:hypothetical protein